MAKVILLSAAAEDAQTDYNLAALRALLTSAAADLFRVHSLTDDPAAADVILFADLCGAGLHFQQIRGHPLVRRYREKCFIFCSNASVIPFLPGVYASIEKRWCSRRTRSGFHVDLLQNDFANYTRPTEDLPYLFSFVGSTDNAPVRRRLRDVTHERSFFRDTADEFNRVLHDRMSAEERLEYYRQYVEITKSTKFVLCPRGVGVATIRLFETMRMGRVPVIISDDWVQPTGPAWERFSIRVRESEVATIPQLLERREREAVAMGELARDQWEQWFSERAAFHRVVEWCLEIKRERRVPESLARIPVYLQLLRPVHLRHSLRRPWHALRERFAESRRPAAVPRTAHSGVIERPNVG